MEAEIIAVGTELLLGDILNTNAQFLSRELAALGITVHFQTVVGDNPARLESVVRQARGRSDLLVFSGGLGPTEDDLTKQTVARAFGDTLRFDEAELEKIRAFFTAWGRTMPENNKKQAMVPTHGRKIPNANGTAPGMIFEDQAAPGKYAVLLPGPPKELQPMFLNSVKPWLAAMSDSVLHSVTLRVTGVGESHLESRIGHLLENANPTAAVYAKTAEVVIRITAKAASEDEARRVCLDYAKHFYDILGDCVYAMDADSLEEVVVKELAARGLTVATAESCTGGMLSQRITAVPGASGVFAYGACTYANDIKEKMLGVRHETLEAYGAVSPETAAEMARGVRKAAGADFGVGITGIAGPGGGTPEKPVGLVYLAACSADTVYVQKLVITGRTREVVRLSSTQHALEMVRRLAQKQPVDRARMFKANSDFDWNAPLKKRRSSKYAAPIAVLAVLLVALAVACWYFFTHFSLGGGNGAGGALPVSGSTSISTSASSGEPASVPGTDASVSQPAGDGGSGTPDAGGASSTPQSSGNTGVVHPFG